MTKLFKAREPRGASNKAPRLSLGAREAITGYAMITPMAIGYFIFMVVPIFVMFWLSTTNYSLFGKAKFIGLDNYVTLFTDDPVFWETVWNTVYFTVLFVPLNMLICLGLALMMYNQFKGVGFFRTVLFTPYVTSMVAWAIVWKYLYQTDNGLINVVMGWFGLDPVNWLYNESVAIPISVVVTLLKGLGMNTVIFISALKDVPDMYYEAARLDGASSWKQFKNITLPMISQSLFLALILTIIGCFKVFAQIYVMSKGGPVTSSYVFVYYIYVLAFRYYKFGLASALSTVLFFIILILTGIQWFGRKKWVFYES
jgi:multiple sugar transport system permease protein